MLTKLPNGNWIDPLAVSGIRHTCAGHRQHFVHIDTVYGEATEQVIFASDEDARAWADGLAELHNERTQIAEDALEAEGS
jgi:hypothetical protein